MCVLLAAAVTRLTLLKCPGNKSIPAFPDDFFVHVVNLQVHVYVCMYVCVVTW
jgi:hypothetical protein